MSKVDDQIFFKLSIPGFIKYVAFLPSFGAIFCILWSVIYDFESSTATHCRVANFLPTISSAIGSKAPQLYVWRICICLHSTPRILLAMCYYRYHTSIHVGKHQNVYKILAALCSLLHIIENLALVVLTYISSKENYEIHEKAFISFMVFSLTYMCVTTFVFGWGRSSNGRVMTQIERQSYRYKIWLFSTNISVFMLAIYLFYRHNQYCEPGVFGGMIAYDYIAVILHIAYCMTAILDMGDHYVSFVEVYKKPLKFN